MKVALSVKSPFKYLAEVFAPEQYLISVIMWDNMEEYCKQKFKDPKKQKIATDILKEMKNKEFKVNKQYILFMDRILRKIEEYKDDFRIPENYQFRDILRNYAFLLRSQAKIFDKLKKEGGKKKYMYRDY